MNRKIIIILIIFNLFFITPGLVVGQVIQSSGIGGPSQSSGIGGTSQLCNPLGGCSSSGPNDLTAFIKLVLAAVVKIGAVVVVFFVIYSGFLMVTAQGNEEKLKKAKNALLWTLVGAAILLGAQLLADVISNTITALSKP